MKVTVIVDDRNIAINGVFEEVSFNYPDNIHAIQWSGEKGSIEYRDGSVSYFTDISYVQPYIDAYDAKLDSEYQLNKSLVNMEPAEQVAREIRNGLMTETDWWVLPDRTPTQAQLDYRQSLRNLPESTEWAPRWIWNEESELRTEHFAEHVGVIWPERPNV